jgi:transcriptional regulator with XRE-family HTH domain
VPTTIGEHIKHVRSERGLRQVDAAEAIGVSAATILHWEAGHTEPPVKFMPAIVRFLGYEPWPEPATFGERMRVHRYRHGLSIKEAASQAGVDEGTWAKWEGMEDQAVHVNRYPDVFDKLLVAMAGGRDPLADLF